MINESKKAENLPKKPEKVSVEHEYKKIKEGLKANAAKVIESLKQRVGTGDWKLSEMDSPLDKGKETIDLVFSAPDGKKEKYIIIDVSVPHLGVGQKYTLPGKAKLFQKEREVTATRIKKAIILIRKGTESVSTQSSRIRCPIIEVQLENIVKPEPPPVQHRQERQDRNERPRSNDRDQRPRDQQTQHRQETQQRQPENKPVSSTGIAGVSQDLLFALKEAIVHECLSTMHKRCNKYIRKGLWRWIEREIMDPSVHFYLIILSSIYQGKTGEILSRRFKTPESYSSKPEEVISAIFSRENSLADEIKKSSERHKKALTKFLVCFSQTPPFEYLKSLFLKDFRSHNDGLKARMSVYTTLTQLLERCGFEGEKETQYPLEILDELKVFQGIMTGNYSVLRTDNAAKKLKHLVPQVEWSNEDIYSLRNQLAKALNLPAQEFNINAFLPQAFFHDARQMAETRKEAIRIPGHQAGRPEPRHSENALPAATEKEVQAPAARNEERERNRPQQSPRPNNESRNDRENENFQRQPQRRDNRPAVDNRPATRQPSPVAHTNMPARPVNAAPLINAQASERDNPALDRRLPNECDEAHHRFFENFGGHTDEDTDAIKLALAMVRHEREQAEQTADKAARSALNIVSDEEAELEAAYKPPLKNHLSQAPIADMEPPRRYRPTDNNAQPSGQRPDRKRRFSRNQSRRPRRPNTGSNPNR